MPRPSRALPCRTGFEDLRMTPANDPVARIKDKALWMRRTAFSMVAKSATASEERKNGSSGSSSADSS